MNTFEEIIQKKYFAGIGFSDERERQVFLSYIRGFALLVLDPSVKNILEIGGGQSTTLLAELGRRLNWNIFTVDMNPEAIALKIRSQSISDDTLRNIQFRKGVSIGTQAICSYYECAIAKVGGVPFAEAVEASSSFVETSMDARKAYPVAKALGLEEFKVGAVLGAIVLANRFAPELLKVFRTPGDELEHHANTEPVQGCMKEIMDTGEIDAVFLDSGEFSSLPEWEIIQARLRPGGYVMLHDIFFPKSFKNWIVCGAIRANPGYEILYIDRSTPQGLMVAQKKP